MIAVALGVGVAILLVSRGGPKAISGDILVPGPCPHVSHIGHTASLVDSQGRTLGSGLAKIAEKEGDCHLTFTFEAMEADEYKVKFAVEAPGEPVATYDGPSYTPEELAKADYHLTMTQSDFASTDRIPTQDPPDEKSLIQLNLAAGAALGSFNHSGSFAGITPARLTRFMPSVTFNGDSTATAGAVSVRDVTASTIVLATMSSSGAPVCFAAKQGSGSDWFVEVAGVEKANDVSHGIRDMKSFVIGLADAQTPEECAEAAYQG